MTRLILLNGAPGVGKSTLARRWAADHPGTLDAFAAVATGAGASFSHVLLRDPAGSVCDRFRRRTGADPWHDEVRRLVDDQGGDALLSDYERRLAELCSARPSTLTVESVEGDEDGTYAALVRALSQHGT